jgi:AraC family transcriptional regulator
MAAVTTGLCPTRTRHRCDGGATDLSEQKLPVAGTESSAAQGIWVQRWRWPDKPRHGAPRSYHKILLFEPGAGFEACIEDQRSRVEQASNLIALVPAGLECVLEAQAPANEFRVLCVEPDAVRELALKNGGAHCEIMDVIGQQDEVLHRLCCALEAAKAEAGPSDLLLGDCIGQAILTRLLGRYVRRHPTAPGALNVAALRRTLAYINDNLAGKITVTTMAGAAGLSPYHFSRLFAQATGHPPHRYVVLRRVERAVTLIRGSGLSLAEIAYRTGFADQSHLSRHIRRLRGLSPKSLRERSETTIPAPS